MEENSEIPRATVPVHVPEPADHAPPTLAQPASGPVAEMSGAMKSDGAPAAPSHEPSAAPAEPATVNGLTEPTSQPAPTEPEKPAEPAVTDKAPKAADEDTEMKDQPAPEPGAQAAPVETNGAAPSSQKASNNKRKSTGGVPEHKSKKLNKKKSQQKITHIDAQPGDYFFARLKSYPPWPSIICDEDMLPQSLVSTRPVTTKRADGTYRPDYDDGGKKVSERTFPVMFLHTNEFAWIPNTDLNPLNPEDCKEVSEKGKTKALAAAYVVASEGHDLHYFKTLLSEHESLLQAEREAQQARAAEKAEKAAKKKRKSDAAATPAKATEEDEDVDMEDAEVPVSGDKPTKKRKKTLDEDDIDADKPAKTPKTKLKLTTSKTPTTAEKKAKDTPKAAKPRSERKSKKAEDSPEEDVVEEAPKEPEKPVDPVEERKAREREVLFLRHKLQKGFLSRDQAPQEEEMPQMSNYIKKLEAYEELEVSIIRSTKINKVLKALIKLNTIPRDEEFNFRSRSYELLDKMNKQLGATDDTDHADKNGDVEPATNGVAKEDDPKPIEPAPAPEPATEALTQLAEPAKAPTPSEPVPAAPIATSDAPLDTKSGPAAVPGPAPVVISTPAIEENKVEPGGPQPATAVQEAPSVAPETASAPTAVVAADPTITE